jgi:AraC-like DNA-binding protein
VRSKGRAARQSLRGRPPTADAKPLSRRQLAVFGGASLSIVTCAGATERWAQSEEAGGPSIVFVRRGSFMRRADGAESLLDATVVYFERPGTEEQYAHPAGPDDECLVLELPPDFLAWFNRSPGDLPARPVFTSAAIDLCHRGLARAAAAGTDDFELHERSARLVAAVLDGGAGRSTRGRPATASARRRLVTRARESLLADPSLRLDQLARRVASSPHHLSRVFHDETGQTLSAYRNRLRVTLALARLEDGERDLAALAADLGFADHAHLTRMTRAQVGAPPSRIRRLLDPSD